MAGKGGKHFSRDCSPFCKTWQLAPVVSGLQTTQRPPYFGFPCLEAFSLPSQDRDNLSLLGHWLSGEGAPAGAGRFGLSTCLGMSAATDFI